MNRQLLSLALLLALLAGLLGIAPAPVRATILEVDSPLDDAYAHDISPGDGLCIDQGGLCTLRAAIEEANAHPGADTITFDFSMSILLNTTVGALPAINEQLSVNASSVWNAVNNQPGVTLNGGNQSFSGLMLLASDCEVYGLFLINFLNAIDIRSSYNTIGAPFPGQANFLSSNGGYGVAMYGSAAHHNVVSGNVIGLSITGDTKQPNFVGVNISGGAHHNTIGGDMVGKGNVISGNTYHGIEIYDANSDSNRVGANYIGLPLVGSSQDVGNGGAGVYVYNGPRYTQIGSTGSDLAGNLIAFNGNAGVILWAAHTNWVETNIIISNKADGVTVHDAFGNLLMSNEIAGNGQRGVFVRGATAIGNRILVNSIHHHSGYLGIDLFDGGNAELPAPTITAASSSGAAGTGCAGCNIHLFSDSADEGETYEGFASADGFGNWSYSGFLRGPNVTATNTDAGGNTSEFSAPFAIGRLRFFLPFVVRNY